MITTDSPLEATTEEIEERPFTLPTRAPMDFSLYTWWDKLRESATN